MAGIAGADTRILRTARSDLAKYSALGAVVLMTALMAAVSGGFAVSMALQHIPARGRGRRAALGVRGLQP